MKKTILFLLLLSFVCKAQSPETKKDDTAAKLKITIKGLFQARYSFNNDKDIDLTGLHHTDSLAVYNGFDIKRARLLFASKISDRTEVVLLVNLADFKNDPKNKVLENAYLTYKLSNYINFKIGQFRPAFGLENMYSVDVIKSMDYSNQYSAFGSNGWQSFQIGASVYGTIKGEHTINYALSVVNGNNRNQVMDADNGKQFSSRMDLLLNKKYNLKAGLNGAIGSVYKSDVYAAGIDLSGVLPFSEKWSLLFEAEAKQGNNHVLFYKTPVANRIQNVSQYQMQGMYFLPDLRYDVNYHRLTSLEFSCRYEYFDPNFKNNSNPRQTFTPMISAEFLKSYNARIQLGVIIDRYKKNSIETTQYSNEQFIIQIQSRL
ncbi:porin [Flavobacterium sp. TMP13]|uniref:porin n=1 Tax=Flavobacterium sp. TMP13 TaxID=3425950 RepID=UPI003D781ACC